MGRLAFICLTFFLVSIWATSVHGASVDLVIDPESITFSDDSPMEGDAISINAALHNQGDGEVTEDVEVRFIEGDPEKGGLQIASNAFVLGLKAGASGKVQVKWRAAPGRTKIYVIADPDNLIKESKEDNNTVVKLIKGRKWKGSKVNEEQIKESVKKGIDWLWKPKRMM